MVSLLIVINRFNSIYFPGRTLPRSPILLDMALLLLLVDGRRPEKAFVNGLA
jgi:hypothetical protein